MSNYGNLSQSNIQESNHILSYDDLKDIHDIFENRSQSIENELSFEDNYE